MTKCINSSIIRLILTRLMEYKPSMVLIFFFYFILSSEINAYQQQIKVISITSEISLVIDISLYFHCSVFWITSDFSIHLMKLTSKVKTNPVRFAPKPFPPLVVSPPRRFPPGRFAPISRFAPLVVSPH